MHREIVLGADFEIWIQGRGFGAAPGDQVEDLHDGAVGAVFDREQRVVIVN
jgi:hypothetical protein